MNRLVKYLLVWIILCGVYQTAVSQKDGAYIQHLNDSLLQRLRTEQLLPAQRAELLYQMKDDYAFYNENQEDKAYYLSLIPEALAVAKASGNVEQQIEFYFIRFRTLPDSILDRNPSIIDTIVQLMQQSKRISEEYYHYTNTIRNHFMLERMAQKAIEVQRFEVKMAERGNDPARLALSTLLLCNIFINYDNAALAWPYIRRASTVADTTSDQNLRYFYLSTTSMAYKAEGKLDSAELWGRRVIQYFEKAHQKPAYTSDYRLFAEIFEKTNQLDSALFYLHYLRVRAEKKKRCESLSDVYTNLGNFHLRHQQMDSALVYAEKSLRASRGCPGFYNTEQAESHLLAGAYFNATRQWAKAVPHLLTVQSVFDTLPIKFQSDNKLKAYQLLAESYEKLGNPSAALVYMRLSSALSDTIAQEKEGKNTAQLGIVLESERYQKAVEAAGQQSRQQQRVIVGTGILMVFFLGLAAFAFRQLTQKRKLFKDLEREKTKSEALLLNILPTEIASRLKGGQNSIADYFDEASVIFIDIVGFTQMATHRTPVLLVEMLNDIFTRFDALSSKHGLEKIKTIGDCYMAVAGVPHASPDHLERTVELARDLLAEMEVLEFDGERVSFRIGIETGPLVAGVIGEKRFIYDLWGDTVNTASRMESSGIPNAIHTTRRVYDRLRDRYEFETRGFIEIKGKGTMETFVLR